MTTIDLLRWAAPATAAVALLSLTACSGEDGAAATPVATVTVTATTTLDGSRSSALPSAEAAPSPSGASRPAALPSEEPERPPISAKTPPPFGEVFQSDPGHDFTRGISPSSDGVVRARLRSMRDANVVEYVPVRWVPAGPGQTAGHFEEPPEGDVTAFAAPIAADVVFLSAVGCDGKDQTIDGDYLGTERCSRDGLISRSDRDGVYALVTVRKGRIVRVVEIYTA